MTHAAGCADLPYAWVNLRHGVGVEEQQIEETNAAAVGSFTLELGLLSRLTGTVERTSVSRLPKQNVLWNAQCSCHVTTHKMCALCVHAMLHSASKIATVLVFPSFSCCCC